MRISHRYRFIFFARPKTGSSSVRRYLDPYTDVHPVETFRDRTAAHPFYPHMRPVEARPHFQARGWDFAGYAKIVFARNPWARIVSLYRHVRDETPGLPAFPDWVRTIEPDGAGGGGEDWQRWRRYGAYSLEAFTEDADGSSLVDHVVRLEALEELRALLAALGLPEVLARPIPHKNDRARGEGYAGFYDAETRDLVGSMYRSEIERFGYEFEPRTAVPLASVLRSVTGAGRGKGAERSVPPRRGVHIVCAAPGTGYGDAALQYALGIDRLGGAVRWMPVERHATGAMEAGCALEHVPPAAHSRAVTLFEKQVHPDALLLELPPPRMHAHWARQYAEKRLYTFVAWEADRLPADWLPALQVFRKVLVPSEFNRALLAGQGLEVDVVPHVARDVDVHDPEPRPAWGSVRAEDFVFYTIGTWDARKALEETIRAFLRAFTRADPVALVVKTTWTDFIALAAHPAARRSDSDPFRVSTAATLARILRDFPDPARVHLIPHPVSAREIDALHRHGDCYVSLSRCEGFGLCPFDALLFGNPAVITTWGGTAEYLPEEYPLAVGYELEPTARAPDDGQHMISEEARWARADPSHASELMRKVFEDRSAGAALARDLAATLRARYASDVLCTRLAALLELELA